MADLVTLADAREFLQKQTGQTGTDAALSSLITRASAVIQREIDTFITPAESASRTFTWDGYSSFVSLLPYVARSVGSVTIDPGESSESTLSSDAYRLGREPAKDGVYSIVELDLFQVPGYGGNFRGGGRRVLVTGQWGYAVVPDGLKHACLLTVTAWYRGRVAGFSSGYENADGGETARMELIPGDAFRILNQWRRYAL